ncbi:Probable sodium/metabolite cotransporter BASS1, chloroplastic [Linum perenne]
MQSSLAFSLSNNIRFNPLLACRQFVDSSSSSTFLKSDFPSIKLHTATQLKLRFSASPSPVSSRSTVVSHCGISSNNSSASETGGIRAWVEAVTEAISTAFPIWVSLGCLLGLLRPASFGWVTPKWTMFGLTLTMLGMGMTLTLDDLSNAFAMPKQLFAGFMLQYSVMPVSAFLVSKLLNLPSHYAAGLILVGCCPGGTASNIVTYIARGNVALSVLMTALSTLTAVVGHDTIFNS